MKKSKKPIPEPDYPGDMLYNAVGLLFDWYELAYRHVFGPKEKTIEEAKNNAVTKMISVIYAHILERFEEEPRDVLMRAIDDVEGILEEALKRYEVQRSRRTKKKKRSRSKRISH